jgi:RNA polymerase sigma factor (sigma-70 family)
MAKRPERDAGDQPSDTSRPGSGPGGPARPEGTGDVVKRGTSPQEEPEDDSGPDPYEALAAQAKQAGPPPPAEREQLMAAATNGDQGARQALANGHLGWVARAAEERAGRGLSQGDLFQEGSIGLMRAIDEFGGSGLADFEAFARERVVEEMERALKQEEKAQEDARRLIQAAEDYQRAEFGLRTELGREATPAELAAKLEWSQDRLEAIAAMVEEAQRRHDEELLVYLDPEELDLDRLLESQEDPAGRPAQSGRLDRRPFPPAEGPSRN